MTTFFFGNMFYDTSKNLSWGAPLNFEKTSAILDFLKNVTTLERVDKTKRGFHYNLSFIFYMVHQPLKTHII